MNFILPPSADLGSEPVYVEERGRDGQALTRVVIEHVSPAVDGGLFPAKTSVGDVVPFEADVFTDGHDLPAARVIVRHEDADPRETPMVPLGNDHWRSEVPDRGAGNVSLPRRGVDRLVGDVALRAREAAGCRARTSPSSSRRGRGSSATPRGAHAPPASTGEADRLKAAAAGLRRLDPAKAGALATSGELNALMGRHADRRRGAAASAEYVMVAARERARHGAWYELFPRSVSPKRGRHGTLRDVAALVPDIADLGFDVLYLPPIHPIGRTNRKGPNNAAAAGPDDPGSPWAIGSEAGGHTAIHPELGTFDDFGHLLAELKRHDMELALDLAFQCSPDHPWVQEHPEWFRHRADGTIRYAENPPKKYEDIYPLDFETKDREGLWHALLGVVLFWMREGGPDLPRRQPAHEAVRLLGVAARGGQERASRRPVPVGGVHPPARDGAPGQDRLRSVLHVLHVAADQAGADRRT